MTARIGHLGREITYFVTRALSVSDVSCSGIRLQGSSQSREPSTHKTVKTRFWLWREKIFRWKSLLRVVLSSCRSAAGNGCDFDFHGWRESVREIAGFEPFERASERAREREAYSTLRPAVDWGLESSWRAKRSVRKDLGVKVWGLRLGFGFQVEVWGNRVLCRPFARSSWLAAAPLLPGAGFRVWSLGSGDWGLGVWGQGLGVRVANLGFRVWG